MLTHFPTSAVCARKNIGEHYARQRLCLTDLSKLRCFTRLRPLLRQVVCDTHLTDGMQLRLEPVDMVLLVVENALGQCLGSIIALSGAQLDAVVQTLTASISS